MKYWILEALIYDHLFLKGYKIDFSKEYISEQNLMMANACVVLCVCCLCMSCVCICMCVHVYVCVGSS